MTRSGDLERRYRRWMRWYPEAFRREYEAEIVEVLAARAAATGRPPGAIDVLDLAVNGLAMRLRGSGRRPARTRAAVRVMYVGAALELVTALTVLATAGSVGSALTAPGPGFAVRVQALVAAHLTPLALGAVAGTGVWLALAWAVGRGRRSARIAFTLFFITNLYGLLNGLARGSATYAPADVVAGTLLCFVHLLAVGLVLREDAATVHGIRSVARRLAGQAG